LERREFGAGNEEHRHVQRRVPKIAIDPDECAVGMASGADDRLETGGLGRTRGFGKNRTVAAESLVEVDDRDVGGVDRSLPFVGYGEMLDDMITDANCRVGVPAIEIDDLSGDLQPLRAKFFGEPLGRRVIDGRSGSVVSERCVSRNDLQ
jgi:hypothetical protein